MHYAYFIENTPKDYIDNTELFRLINDLEIDENEVYIDEGIDKSALDTLLDILKVGDRLVIRSVVDLAEEAKELLEILGLLQDKEVILCSVTEPFLNGPEYLSSLKGFIGINNYYLEKRRKEKYQEAKDKGTVGRPKMTAEIEKAIRLYKTKAFTTAEIEKLAGVSTSTLYRYLKDIDKE